MSNLIVIAMRATILIAVFICLALPSRAQLLEVTNGNVAPFTPENLISNVFLGNGVEVTSITYNGVPTAVGYFTGGAGVIGIERGIVMTSGVANSSPAGNGSAELGSDFASVPNFSFATDPDLALQTTSGLFDVAVYTISFIPTSDTLRFRYCFGSEEYPEFACSPFNDVFGFFIQGPGYPTPTNIARIPGTMLPVTINNIHPANPVYNCGPFNAQYYNDNNNSSNQPTYDGFTDVFTAEAIVQPCQEYTIKLAIADVSDRNYDSGVFLEAKSFGTGSLRVNVVTLSPDGAVAEGCASGAITFSLPQPAEANFPIDYNVWGSAQNGIDFENIPSGLSIAAGQQELTIPIVAFEDNLSEGSEFLAIDVQRDPCNRDTIYVFIKDNILVPPQLPPDTAVCLNAQPLLLDGTVPVPLPDPPSFSFTDTLTVFPHNTEFYAPILVGGVQPSTLGPGVIRSVCLNMQHPWCDDMDFFLISPGGQFLELSTDNGSNGMNYTNTCFTPDATQVISFPGPFAPATAAPFSGNWLPEGPWSDLWDGNYPTNGNWQLLMIDDAMGFSGTLYDWTITFEPAYNIQYQWSPGAGLSCTQCPVATLTPSSSAWYRVDATDTYGCQTSDSIRIDILDALEAPVVFCLGSDASSISFGWNNLPNATAFEVNVNGSGWIPANGDTTHIVTGLGPNDVVTLEVRALNSNFVCPPATGTATCSNCLTPQASALTQPASCANAQNGSVAISTDNLNPPYTFDIPGQTNSTGQFGNLGAGSYLATITDASGCSVNVPFSIGAPPPLAAVISTVQNAACFGGADGQILATASGGAGTLSFQWNDPANQSTPLATGLPAGSYTLTVTDANLCTTTTTATVGQPPQLLLSLSKTDLNCFGQNTGAAAGSAIGGTQPYQFLWNTGQNATSIASLSPGAYSLTVTDANGCTNTDSILIQQPPQLLVSTSASPVDCHGQNTGSASAAVSGGTSPYTLVWNDPAMQTTPDALNLPAGNYTLVVTDAQGCTAADTVQVTEPAPILAGIAVEEVDCFGGANGTATATVSGGIPPYALQWNDPGNQSGPQATALAAGAYQVNITDANNCTLTASAVVGQPDSLSLTLNALPLSCATADDGGINASVSGGVPPYTYLWSSGETTEDLAGKSAGNYSLVVTDANGCNLTGNAVISTPNPITSMVSITPVDCYDNNTGSIQATLGGGAPPLSISWTGPGGFNSTSLQPSGLFAGSYTATVTDAAGCTASIVAEVTQAPFLQLNMPEVADTICFGAADGQITAIVSGGTPPYVYNWSHSAAATGPSVTGLVTGFYPLRVTDANGCTRIDSSFIFGKPQLFAYVENTPPTCTDGTNGRARVTGAFYGQTLADSLLFSYSWSTTPPQTSLQAQNLTGGQTYSVTLTDKDGCTATQTTTLGNPPPVVPAILDVTDARCQGEASGSARATASGGTEPYTYFWTAGAGQYSGAEIQEVPAGNYRLTVTDVNGCFGVTTLDIRQPDALNALLTSQSVNCFGGNDGVAQASVSGGSPPYQYQWNSGSQSALAQQLSFGIARLSLTDANGCVLLDSILVDQPATALSGNAEARPVDCAGGRNGSVSIQASGGTPPYRYAVNNGVLNGSPVQIGLRAGAYQPLIRDGNGCELALPPVVVEEPEPPVVDLGPDITIEAGESVQLQTQVSNALDPFIFEWTGSSARYLSCTDCPDPVIDSLFFPLTFRVDVEDARGCTASGRISVQVELPDRVYVPTGFTPNGDGNNDRLLVHGQSGIEVLTFRIFDRWGEMVFENGNFAVNDPDAGWDGTFSGQPMNPGVYVWLLEYRLRNGAIETARGEFTLIR